MKYIDLVKRVKKILPAGTFLWVQHRVRKIKRSLVPKFSETELRKIFTEQLGLHKGAVVFVHCSFNSLNTDFPLPGVLSLLLDIVDKNEGTLLFPTTQFVSRAEDYLNENIGKVVFDIKRTPSQRGLLTEWARRYKGAVRSLHPTDSVVAIGKHAEELTNTHHFSLYPLDENSPYYKMMKYDAIIVGVGVPTDYLSFVHCIEDVMKERFPLQTRNNQTMLCLVKDSQGNETTFNTKVASRFIGSRNVRKYIEKNIPAKICRDLTIKYTPFFTARSKDLYDRMMELANKNITIYNT